VNHRHHRRRGGRATTKSVVAPSRRVPQPGANLSPNVRKFLDGLAEIVAADLIRRQKGVATNRTEPEGPVTDQRFDGTVLAERPRE